jgi:hypothetical protein
MKHIDFELLQRYIDGEVSTDEKTAVESHLTACKACSERWTQLQRRSIGIKSLLNGLSDAEVGLPALPSEIDGKLPVTVSAASEPGGFHESRSVWKRWAIGLSAACMIGVIFLFKPLVCRSENPEMVRIQREIVEVDANCPYTEQETVLSVIDPEGNVSYIE